VRGETPVRERPDPAREPGEPPSWTGSLIRFLRR
jgi:hypothetical protein